MHVATLALVGNMCRTTAPKFLSTLHKFLNPKLVHKQVRDTGIALPCCIQHLLQFLIFVAYYWYKTVTDEPLQVVSYQAGSFHP